MGKERIELIDDIRKQLTHAIDATRQNYLRNYVEDPVNGSTLDCAILEAFNAVEMKAMESLEMIKKL